MSAAIDQMTGGRVAVSDAVAMAFLGALHKVCTSKQPIGRLAIVLSPENAYCALRAELVDQYHGFGLHGLAARISRHSRGPGEILILCIGDDAPVLRRIPIGPVRYALSAIDTKGGGDNGCT